MKCILLFMHSEPAMTPRKTQCGESLRSPAAPAEADDITIAAQCVIYRQSSTLCVCLCVCVGVMGVWVCKTAPSTETPAIKRNICFGV